MGTPRYKKTKCKGYKDYFHENRGKLGDTEFQEDPTTTGMPRKRPPKCEIKGKKNNPYIWEIGFRQYSNEGKIERQKESFYFDVIRRSMNR